MAGVGLAVALLMPPARVLPGPGKGLAVAPRSSPARCLPGVLWISSARIPPRVVVFGSLSDLVYL